MTDINCRMKKAEIRLDGLDEELRSTGYKIDGHIKHFTDHEESELRWHSEFIETQRDNTEAITLLASKTGDMIEAWEAANGAIKIANTLGNLLKWAAGLVAATMAAFAAYSGKL